MILFYGRKTARIKKFIDNQQHCPSCKAFDLEVKVYRGYFHLYLIPIIPIGDKTVKIRCRSCGEPIRSEVREKEYENATNTPFYLYSIPIVIVTVVASIFVINYNTQNKKKEYAQNPVVRDVYLIKSNANKFETFYFCKLIEIKKDSVLMLRSKYEYLDCPDEFSEKDYFMKDDTLAYSRVALKAMLDSAEINAVERDYDEHTGFNRVQ